jgi:hypothetical protein
MEGISFPQDTFFFDIMIPQIFFSTIFATLWFFGVEWIGYECGLLWKESRIRREGKDRHDQPAGCL